MPSSRRSLPVRFLHIPKCGGSTFGFVLTQKYAGYRSFSLTGNAALNAERYRAALSADPRPIGLFYGHAPIKTGIDAADEATTLAILRDPVSRVKSFCTHVWEGKSPHLLESFPPGQFDLDDLLDSGEGELSNLQTKMLINEGSCTSDALLMDRGVAQSVDTAWDHLLNRVYVFGLQEAFDESLLHFADHLGWGLPFYLVRNTRGNDSSQRLRFSKTHLEKIRQMNEADQLLYERARDWFQKNVHVENLSARTRRLHWVNRHLVPWGERFKLFALYRRFSAKVLRAR